MHLPNFVELYTVRPTTGKSL